MAMPLVKLVLINDEVFQGSYSSNPFNFKHMFVNEIGLVVNGQPMPYAEPLKFKFNENGAGKYIRAYHALVTGTDIKCSGQGNNISR